MAKPKLWKRVILLSMGLICLALSVVLAIGFVKDPAPGPLFASAVFLFGAVYSASIGLFGSREAVDKAVSEIDFSP